MNGNVIRTITIRGQAEGIDKLTADVNKLTASYKGVTVATEETEKSSARLEQQLQRQNLRLDEAARRQNNLERETRLLDRGLKQHLITQEQYAQRVDLLNQRYGQATTAQKAFAAATSGVSAQLIAMSAGAGPVGTFLAALGPWGFAASVGLGAASAVFNRLVEGAERIGDKAIELRKFSDVTGLAVTQIKALTQAGGRLGVDSEEIQTSLEKFSVGLNEARKGTGSLFDQIRAINPQLAIELAQTTNAAQGWDILAKALRGATEASQRNALARAAFGRGGIETGLVAVESAAKGGIDAMAKGIKLTEEWVTETARLRAENIQLEKSIKNTMDAAYAVDVLRRQNEFLQWQKKITEEFIKMDKFSVPKQRPFVAGAFFGEEMALDEAAPRQRSTAAQAAKLDPETLAGWQQLDDAMGAVVQQSAQLVNLLEQEKNARALLANTERERLALLGAAATEQERLNLRTLELKVALDQNKLSLEDSKRAGEGLSQQFNNQMVALQGQLSVAQQLTGIGQINAQYEATINNAKQQGLILSQEIQKAELQRAIALAQVNTAAEQTLKSLQPQGALLAAATGKKSDERSDLPKAA